MVSKDTFNVFIAVYMMASRRPGTIYVGVTSQLIRRIKDQRNDPLAGFTKTYGVKHLVWYERHENMEAEIRREKSLKKYKREWKINLIERENPNWDDMFPALAGMNKQNLPKR